MGDYCDGALRATDSITTRLPPSSWLNDFYGRDRHLAVPSEAPQSYVLEWENVMELCRGLTPRPSDRKS